MAFNLTHVKHDPAHCLAPGLFRSIKPGDQKGRNAEVIYKYADGKQLEFYMFEPLTNVDMRVLQGLVAMAGPDGLVLDIDNPKSEEGKQLSLFLEPKWDALSDNALVVKDSFYALAKELGYKDPNSTRTHRDIRESIDRMWKVSIIVRDGHKKRGFRLLSEYASDDEDKRLFVALNPMLAEAIMGKNRHIRIDMPEIRALASKSPASQLMHQYLCGYINPGKTHPTAIHIDTLCGYVWPVAENEEIPDETAKKRRTRIRKSFAELETIGWKIEEEGKNYFKIFRPKAPKNDNCKKA